MGAPRARNLCALVTLDVRNAFNTAPWLRIDRALRKKGVPLYLVRILRSYLLEQTLLVGPDLTPRSVKFRNAWFWKQPCEMSSMTVC